MSKHKNSRTRRGDFVACVMEPHDRKPECITIRRVVKASRDGVATHVCREFDWQGNPKPTANAGNAVAGRNSSAFVRQVLKVGPYARDSRLAEYADGSHPVYDKGVWITAYQAREGIRRICGDGEEEQK